MITLVVCAPGDVRVRVRTRDLRLYLLAAVLALVTGPVGVAASSSQTKPFSYVDVVELYRRGEDGRALKQLATLAGSDIRIGQQAVLRALVNGNRTAAEAAAVLHTVAAFAASANDDVFGFRSNFRLARAYVDAIAAVDHRVTPFVRTWQLFVMASYHGQRGVQSARDFGRSVRDPHGDSAFLLLALGATEEMGWGLHQEDDPPPNVDGDLKEAERLYRQAIVVSPELVEARVRLGRVLALRHDDESVKVLEQIGDAVEAPYQYLARLFEGDLLERAGRLADAERQYLAAVTVMPEPQSGFIALAHVRHAQGARAQSAQDVRVTTGAKGVPDTADPWFWYSRGTAWRRQVYLEDLRKMMAQ